MSKGRRRNRRFSYSGERLRALSFPLGGIGTGTVALCGDGGLRQWQIFNNINHNAHVPHSFFAVSVREGKREAAAYVLQSNDWYDSEFEAAPLVSDHIVPTESRRLLEKLPGVHDLEFIGEYPVAEIHYRFGELPLSLTLQAYSPFVPLDADDSGLPAVIFHFHAVNQSSHPLALSILMSQQNAIGWDDATEINGIAHPSFGGNTNTILRKAGVTAILMDKTNHAKDDSRYGQMLITALDESASARAQWVSLEELWNDFSSDGLLDASPEGVPSPAGQTVNAALASKLFLQPGESGEMSFLLAWYFPNRYVDWSQPTLESEQDINRSKLWLGNYYAARFASALEIAEYVHKKLEYFDETAGRFREAMYSSTLPDALIEAVSTQISVIRSPTCFRAADGRFYGFEGCLGASTEMIGERGGCCPLNCTHVWNYAMTLARLFPQLERSMRETEWLHQQHETGYLPHRVVVPLYLRRPWDKWIGGPPYPALDGLLGAVLKTYREFRAGAGIEWLMPLWDHVRLAMDHVMSRYDRGDGLLCGPQPCTYDVEIEGPNSFITSLYLAALRAAEGMAKAVGDKESRAAYHERFLLAKKSVDKMLWNGEYYIHKADVTESVQSYGTGCHSDQLFGQWWAHALGLGHILPSARVWSALASIVRYNRRENLREHQQFPRKYLKDDEAGLLNCTWPNGNRPDTPLLYSDEVWTGMEYEVAGALLYENMIDEAIAVLHAARKRQDGRFRSPWNDVECGDHYVRAMSSWLLLEAGSGFSYDESRGVIGFEPRIRPEKFSAFFATDRGWGKYSQEIKSNRLRARLFVAAGRVRIFEFQLTYRETRNVMVKKGTQALAIKSKSRGNKIHVQFYEAVEINQDEILSFSIG
jgi:uncharacterized protein (DUF608 family)